MGANPISETEFDAYCRRRHLRPPVWAGDVLMRLDDAVLAILRDSNGETKPAEKLDAPPKGEISLKDRKGVRGMLSGIAARRRAAGLNT